MQKYSTYKPTNVEWLGDVPSYWKVDRLRDIASINSETLGTETPNDFLLRYIDISNVDYNGVISFEAIETLEFESAPSRAKRITKENDTIVSSVRPNLQAVCYINFDDKNLICSTGFNVVRTRDKILDSRFLFYFLIAESSKEYFVSRANGIGYPAIGDYDFGSLKISFPVKAEQTAIAAYLDEATANIDKVIATKQQQLEKLEQYRKSKIHECVTKGLDENVKLKPSGAEWLGGVPENWKVITIKNYAYVFASNVDKKTEDGEVEVELCNYVDVYKNEIISKEIEFMIASATEAQIEKFQLQMNDILLTKDSETPDDIAVPAIVKFTKENLLCGYHLMIIRCFKNLLPDYLIWVLRDLKIATQFHREAVGITRFGLAAKHFKNGIVPLPSKTEQKEIADYLQNFCSNISKEKIIVEQQIEKLKLYRKCLIHECVTGKRNVTDD